MSKQLNEIQNKLVEEYIKNGYWKMWTAPEQKHRDILKLSYQKIFDIAELGLICTEISEAMEEVRNKKTNDNKLAIECADIIIRVLNFMSRKSWDAEKYINKKNRINLVRGERHGRGV
jgi:hypothetical protein